VPGGPGGGIVLAHRGEAGKVVRCSNGGREVAIPGRSIGEAFTLARPAPWPRAKQTVIVVRRFPCS